MTTDLTWTRVKVTRHVVLGVPRTVPAAVLWGRTVTAATSRAHGRPTRDRTLAPTGPRTPLAVHCRQEGSRDNHVTTALRAVGATSTRLWYRRCMRLIMS